MFLRYITLALVFLIHSTLFADVITLKKGWNLVGSGIDLNITAFPTADMIWRYKNATWEVASPDGSSSDAVANSSYATLKQIYKNEGFWVHIDNDLTLVFNNSSTFDYRAWGVAGDNSKLTVMVNGVNYTLVAYSKLNIQQSNASASSNKTTFMGTLNSKPITNPFVISNDYSGQEIVIKVFSDENNLTSDALLTQSRAITANNSSVSYDMRVDDADDFRPIQPTDSNIEMPPVAPVF